MNIPSKTGLLEIIKKATELLGKCNNDLQRTNIQIFINGVKELIKRYYSVNVIRVIILEKPKQRVPDKIQIRTIMVDPSLN